MKVKAAAVIAVAAMVVGGIVAVMKSRKQA